MFAEYNAKKIYNLEVNKKLSTIWAWEIEILN
jgi:hypothetical protein